MVMADWSLSQLLASLHEDIEQKLATVRRTIQHPGSKGDASEGVWLDLLKMYLPRRYEAAKAFVVDSKGTFSEQIDVVVFDRQYSPFIFTYEGATIIPAESVYAVFEAKQTVDAGLVEYAQKKAASVRKLHRTSLPIPHAGGIYPAKAPIEILAGILALESEWTPPLGEPLRKALGAGTDDRRLDLGCIASHGHFQRDRNTGVYTFSTETKAATAFLFALIARLQFSGTVPMIDVDAYAEWLVG
jgi:hypothetical protein